MKNKRFTVVLVTMGIIIIATPVYFLIGMTEAIITAVITGITIASGAYLGGQSISDATKYYKNYQDQDQDSDISNIL